MMSRWVSVWSILATLLCAVHSLLTLRSSAAGEPYAFLVGVRQYDKTQLNPLRYTENDIENLKQRLLAAGYDSRNIVVMAQTAGADNGRYLPLAANIRKELALLLSELQADDSILLALSGHGVQFKGEDAAYFCPMDARLKDRSSLVSLSDVFQSLGNAAECKARTRVLLVDACRNNPLSELSKAVDEVELAPVGLKVVEPPGGVVALLSCSPGQKSYESPDLKSGVFFNYVIEGLSGKADLDADGEVSLPELEQFTVKNVQKYARTELGESQTPERLGTSRGMITLAKLKRSSGEPPLRAGDALENSLGIKLVYCPPGRFRMGSPDSDPDAGNYEKPQVDVELTQGFYLGKYEVTQAEWIRVMGTQPWHGREYVKAGDAYPATYISWDDAHEFCKRLSTMEKRSYRLPTEAEWEYACRAGKTARYSFGNDAGQLGDYAWWGGINGNGNAKNEQYAHLIGQKRANAWGLHDMHGNACEYCGDWLGEYPDGAQRDPTGPLTGTFRVERGGSWVHSAIECRSAGRFRTSFMFPDAICGFRVA